MVDCLTPQKPTTKVVDVNLNGTLYFSRIACVFLRQGQQPSEDKSLILISSVAGFKEYPGLFVYQVCPPFLLTRLFMFSSTGSSTSRPQSTG